jgi:large subunit ribosomal protein L7e
MAEQPKSGKKDSAKKESGKKDSKPAADKPAKSDAPKKQDAPKKDTPKKDESKGKPKAEAATAPKKPAEKPKEAAKPADKPKPAEKPKEVAKKAPAPEKKAAPKPAAKAAEKKSSKPKKEKAVKKAAAPAKAFWEKGSAATIPESAMKKKNRDEALKTAADAHRLSSIKALRQRRKVIFKKGEKYAAEYQAAEKDLVRRRRQAKNNGNFFIAPEPKVLLVMRMRGIMRTHPKVTKVLQLLRLRQLNNAVFIKSNHATLTMLRLVEPWITYGAPNLKTVKDLIYKRGYGKIDKQRIPINDNSVISRSLGKYGIICIEDVINEIVNCGPHFKEVNNFLWPFKLNSPLGGWTDKGTHYAEGGDSGNREEDINTLVRRMN